jgi:hypothetical protein
LKTDGQSREKQGNEDLDGYLKATVSGGGISSVVLAVGFSGMQNSLHTSSPPGFSPLIRVLE